MSVSFQKIETILERFPPQPEYLISALQDVQAEFKYIPAGRLQCGVRTPGGALGPKVGRWLPFSNLSVLTPKGVHEIKVCLGTACHLKGGARLVEGLERDLKVERGHTTEDLFFTLDTVNCVGACALAPVVVVDEDYQANTNSRKLKKHLKKVAAE